MSRVNPFFIVIFFVPLLTSAQVSIDALEGKWKVEGRESYEVWEKEGSGLKGHAYKLTDGQKVIKETLKIEVVDGATVYTATVPNQNNGAGIPFTRNDAEGNLLSFENPTHDFPVKIRYESESNDRLFVEVLGADGKGFSFFMDRVE